MTPTLKDIIDITRLHLGLASVEPDDHLVEALGATSADQVNIVATIEERYGIEIDDPDLGDVCTVRELFELARVMYEAKA